jgi:hypothetical protein
MNPDALQKTMDQAKRYALAAAQDSHPLVRYLHASYAVALFDLVLNLSSPEEVYRITGDDLHQWMDGARTFQELAGQNLQAVGH